MATFAKTAPAASAPPVSRGEQSSFFDVRNSLLTPSEGWLTVGLLLAAQLVVVVTVQRADWVDPMPRLWLVAALAFATGLGAAKAGGGRRAQLLLHMAALASGAALALWMTAGTLSGPSAGDRLHETASRLHAWASSVGSQGISNDKLPFTLGLVGLTWLTSYLSAWLMFRLRWTLLALVIPALALLTNQTYLPNSSYPVPLTFFLLFAVTLLGRAHFLERARRWEQQRFQLRAGWHPFMVNVALLTTIVFVVAWAVPVQDAVIGRLHDTYQAARSPWANLENQWERVFAGIPSKRASPLHAFGPALPLRGGIALSEDPAFTVTTDFPTYWRAQAYDVYQGQGWLAQRDQRSTVPGEKVYAPSDTTGYKKREVVAQRVTLARPADVLFVAGQPLEVSVSSQAEVAVPRTYEIDLRDPGGNQTLPPDLAAAARRIASSRGSLSETARLLPPGTRIVEERKGTLVVTRERPPLSDILSIKPSGKLAAGSKYEALSSVSIATVEDLRNDRGAYPQWVTDNYLQVPTSLPQRVRDLATQLTQGITNPYDKGVAIADYLRGFTETYSIDPPPLNADAVDYFLFTQKAGNSDYFASAMTVLLRSVGVPTRLASGYATGVFDKSISSFTVRLADAHSWPEVYFPAYGWLPFEPSPSLQPIPRGPLQETTSPTSDDTNGAFSDSFLDELFLFVPPSPDPSVLPLQDTPVSSLFKDVATTAGIVLGVLAGAVVVVALAAFSIWQLNFVGLPYAHGIYERMARLGGLAWAGPQPTQTPGEYAASLSAAAELPRRDATLIAQSYMKARYTGRPLSDQERSAIESAWRSVRKALVRHALRRFDPRQMLKRAGKEQAEQLSSNPANY